MTVPDAADTPKVRFNPSTLSVLEVPPEREIKSAVGVPSPATERVLPSVRTASKSTTSEMAPEEMSIPLMVSLVTVVMSPVAETWKALAVPAVRVPETSKFPVMFVLSLIFKSPEISDKAPSMARSPEFESVSLSVPPSTSATNKEVV